MKVELTRITIALENGKLELSVDEAKALKAQLDELFKEKTVEKIVYVETHRYPYWPVVTYSAPAVDPVWPLITCQGNTVDDSFPNDQRSLHSGNAYSAAP